MKNGQNREMNIRQLDVTRGTGMDILIIIIYFNIIYYNLYQIFRINFVLLL